jgi:HK97 family phage major capsid protein
MAIQAEVIKSIEDGLEGIKTDLDARIDRKFDKLAQEMSASENAHLLGDGRGNRGNKGNPLAKMADDAGLKAFINGETKSAIVKLDGSIHMLTKSVVVGDGAGTSEEGYNVQPQRDPRLANDPRRRLSLLDFLPSIRVTSNSFQYNALDGYSSAAGYQLNEGALKPEAGLPTDLKTANIATIAHWLPMSEQVLADAPALMNQVNSLMAYGVRNKLEREIIVGAGGTGQIAGLTDSGNYTAHVAASGDTIIDAISKADAALDTAGWRAGLVIVNPSDWAAELRMREGSGGMYLHGLPITRDSVMGLPVITNAALSQGEFIVLDPAQVAILDRMQPRAEWGRIDDQFVRNVVTCRAELRAGLAVFAPGAVIFGEFEA